MSELKFPFKFTVGGGDRYLVELLHNGQPLVTNTRTKSYFTFYTKSEILGRIKKGEWVVVDEVTEDQDPEVTIRQSEVDAYIDEINMLRELVAEITLETDYTALGQQASTYRSLNEKMLSHRSYKQGDGGSTRESELLGQLDTLFAAYDSLASGTSNTTFKPISEMTLEDWQQALEEGWEFEDRYGEVCEVELLKEDAVMFCNYVIGFEFNGEHLEYPEHYSIVKRVK